jgi:hypothetical protein
MKPGQAHDNDWDRTGRLFGRQRRLRYHGNNHVNMELDQLRRKISEAIKLPVRKSILDDDILSLDVTKLAQPALKFIVVGQRPRCGGTQATGIRSSVRS